MLLLDMAAAPVMRNWPFLSFALTARRDRPVAAAISRACPTSSRASVKIQVPISLSSSATDYMYPTAASTTSSVTAASALARDAEVEFLKKVPLDPAGFASGATRACGGRQSAGSAVALSFERWRARSMGARLQAGDGPVSIGEDLSEGRKARRAR